MFKNVPLHHKHDCCDSNTDQQSFHSSFEDISLEHVGNSVPLLGEEDSTGAGCPLDNSNFVMSADEQMVAALKTGAVDIVRRILEGKQGKIPHKHIPNEGYVAQTVEEWVKSPKDGFYFSHFAAKLGDIEILELLSAKGCPMFEPSLDSVGMYPIHWACTTNQLKCVHWLLEQGADINCKDSSLATPLTIAAQYGFADLVAYLIKNGADVNLLDKCNDSSLHWASYKGNVEIVGLLCHLGLPINDLDTYGQTPVHLAALRGNLTAVEYLVLNMKANITLKDKQGKTPLMLAQEKEKYGVVKFLKSRSNTWSDRFYVLKSLFTREFFLVLFSGGRGAEAATWPFYLMSGSMAFMTGMLYFRLLCEEMGGHSVLLVVSTVCFCVMWALFYLCYKTNPGFISTSDPEYCKAYEERLDMLANFSGMDEALGSRKLRQLCHTCHIERPLRAKHCKACRKCVRVFDHHCPFTGCCIAHNNYRWFYLFVLVFNLSAICYIALTWIYMRKVRYDRLTFATFLYCCFFECIAIGLFRYHTTLVARAITTNEEINFYRFQYLKDSNGRFKSPWHKGSFLSNLVNRLHPSQYDDKLIEDCIPLLI